MLYIIGDDGIVWMQINLLLEYQNIWLYSEKMF